MTNRHSYVIVTRMPNSDGWAHQQLRRHRGPGRHRLDTTGTGSRRPAGAPRPAGHPRNRGRHRRAEPPAISAARHATLLVVVASLIISSWFTVSGATAFAQMVRP